MADAISAEPKNWENDILLKVTMPGKELRESTIVKMRKAEERRTHMIDPFSKPVQAPQVIERKPEPVQVQLTEVQKPVEDPNLVVEEANVEEKMVVEEKNAVEEMQAKEEPVVQAPVQETAVLEEPKVEEVDILSKLAAVGKSPAQEWKREMVRRTSENGAEKPRTDPSVIIAERRPEEKKPEFYTNYPGLEMKEKYKVWTIEPAKEEAPVARAIHDSVNSSKVEGFANKITGGDWAVDRLRKR